MSMTGPQMLAYVKRIFKRTDKDTEIYEALTDVIMDMKLRFEYDRFKVEAYSSSITVAGDYKIDIPSDFGHLCGEMRCIDGSNSIPLRKISKEKFDRLYPNPNATDVETGMPQHYCLFGEQFLFGPVPDKTTYAYEFSYSTEAAEAISASTVSVPFADRYRAALRFGSLEHLFAGLDNDEAAIKWHGYYENELEKIESGERKNQDAPAFTQYNDF